MLVHENQKVRLKKSLGKEFPAGTECVIKQKLIAKDLLKVTFPINKKTRIVFMNELDFKQKEE